MGTCDNSEIRQAGPLPRIVFSVNGSSSLSFIAVPALFTKLGESDLNCRKQASARLQIEAGWKRELAIMRQSSPVATGLLRFGCDLRQAG